LLIRERDNPKGMQNECIFSTDRRYRYLLKHSCSPLFEPNFCTWIGANPSGAMETALDPTLTRIRDFSLSWGYNGFIIANVFGLVSTDPRGLYSVEDPVGAENDRFILEAIRETGVVIAAWGEIGRYQNRGNAVWKMIAEFQPLCLRKTKNGFPGHPLYVPKVTQPEKYKPLSCS
jgi:hypothetical protein